MTKANSRLFALEHGTLHCLTCRRIAASVESKGEGLVRIKKGDSCSLLVAKSIVQPHKCLLSTLKKVEKWYHGSLMDKELYNDWMSVNGCFYQLGVSRNCMALWREFTHFKCERKLQDMDREVNLGSRGVVKVVHCKIHQGGYVSVNWSSLRSRDDLECINEIWRWSSDADHAKTNVSARDLIWHMKRYPDIQKIFKRWSHLMSINLYNVTASSLLVHMIGNPHAEKVFGLLDKHKHCCVSMEDYSSLLKNLSIALRRTGRWPDGSDATLDEVTGCAGWELAIGRSKNCSDWPEEFEKRTSLRVDLGLPERSVKSIDTNDEYLAELNVVLKEVMTELVRRPGRQQSWEEFVRDRQTWVSSGSTGGKKMKMNDGTTVRLNKHAYLESLKAEDMVPWLDSEPIMVARASEKYEMGKARAIYGTEVEDYSIASYALAGVEDYLYNIDGVESGLTGLDFMNAMIRRAKIVESGEVECTMIDYADFNYQHTLEAQSAVFVQLADRLEALGYHADKVRAARWISKALLNQWCYFPGKGSTKVRVTQGMFSGCRGTNFKNTILNVSYFRHAKAYVNREFHLRPSCLYNLHQGDDVWITNKSRLWAIATTQVLVSCGLVLQPSKQMFDVGRGEFLRVVYTKEGCQGYSARGVGTLIMKPIQGADIVGPAERAVALNSQLMILARRGFTRDGCRLLWEAIVPYAARAALPTGALSIPVGYLNKSYLDNGLDLGPPRTASARSLQVPPLPIFTSRSTVMEASIPDHMSRDWANDISRRLQVPIKYDDLVTRMHSSNMGDSLRTVDKQEALKKLEKGLRQWIQKYPAHPVVRNTVEYESLSVGPPGPVRFHDFLTTLTANVLPKTYQLQPRSVMSTIMRAISSSPFKSISNAKTATGQSTIQAAHTAILSCPNRSAASEASKSLANLQGRFDDQDVVAILEGVRAGATKYECEFHPNVLSWIQEMATDSVLRLAMIHNPTKGERILEAVASSMDAHVRTARKHPLLQQISRY